MKSLQRRFVNISETNQQWSSYYCFYEAIKDQEFSKEIIQRWFQKLVNKDDYARNEKRNIVAYLIGLSNPLRRPEIKGKSVV
jgi:hypothetical protein